MEMREIVVLKNDLSEKDFRRLKIYICIAAPVWAAGWLFGILQAIRSGDLWLLAAGIFAVLFFLFVFALLYRVFGHAVAAVTFAGKTVSFALGSGKEILLSRYAVKEVVADWARIRFIYRDETGGRKTLWMYRRKWIWSKPLMDEDVLKREFVGAAFYGM